MVAVVGLVTIVMQVDGLERAGVAVASTSLVVAMTGLLVMATSQMLVVLRLLVVEGAGVSMSSLRQETSTSVMAMRQLLDVMDWSHMVDLLVLDWGGMMDLLMSNGLVCGLLVSMAS